MTIIVQQKSACGTYQVSQSYYNTRTLLAIKSSIKSFCRSTLWVCMCLCTRTRKRLNMYVCRDVYLLAPHQYSSVRLILNYHWTFSEHFKIDFKVRYIEQVPGETSCSWITAQVGSLKEPKGLKYIQELALSEPIAGVGLNIALLARSSALPSRVNQNVWSSILKLPLPSTIMS